MGISGRTRFTLAPAAQEPIEFYFATEAKMTWRVVIRIPVGSINTRSLTPSSSSSSSRLFIPLLAPLAKRCEALQRTYSSTGRKIQVKLEPVYEAQSYQKKLLSPELVSSPTLALVSP